MKLACFLDGASPPITLAAFAGRIGVTAQAVLRYARQGRVPRPSVMAAIIRETGGQVRPDDFFPADAPDASPCLSPCVSPCVPPGARP